MPVLDWIGKQAVIKHHREVACRLLEPVPELSVRAERSHPHGGRVEAPGDVGSDGNLIVQGDNLLALKALLPRYAGKVKCIYIDPPYNTGNEDWVYNDNVNSPEIRKWLGEVVRKEGETLDRHDRWLCMMYPRLVLLKQFLREDGVIFISIDDNEVHNLRCVANEAGGLNFVGAVIWERKRKGSHLSRKMTKKTEYILVYSRAKDDIELVGESVGEDEDFPLVKRTNQRKELSIPRDKLGPTSLKDGTYPAGKYGKGGTMVELLDDAVIRGRRFVTDVHLRGPFVWTQENLDIELAAGGKCFLRTKNMSLRALKGSANQGQKGLSSLLTKEVGTNEDASEELTAILGGEVNAIFQYSKPVGLIQTLVRAATFTHRRALILDSFAGSGTTGHAVLKQNAEDGGSRRFILVEMDPGIARDVTAERVKRVAQGYTNAKGEAVAGLGGGFQFCKLSDEPLFTADGQIRADVTFAQLAEFVWFVETGSGFTGDAKSPLIGVHEDRAIYLLYNGILKDHSVGGGNVLTSAVLDVLPPFDGPKVIYAAACRLGSARLRRDNIVFKQTPYALEG